MNICLIPARGNSERIKNKNILSFFGRPIISYSIATAIKSKLFDRIIVSTDSKKISNISKKYGAETPFLRPKKISNSFASDHDVINHFFDYCKKKQISLNKLCYIYPVNPLLKIKTLKKCKKLISKYNCQKVITIAKFSYPIQRALKMDKKHQISLFNKKFDNKRSQDLEIFYQDAAQCYWYNFDKISNFKNKKLRTMGVKLHRHEVCDVDTKEDFNVLKRLYKLRF